MCASPIGAWVGGSPADAPGRRTRLSYPRRPTFEELSGVISCLDWHAVPPPSPSGLRRGALVFSVSGVHSFLYRPENGTNLTKGPKIGLPPPRARSATHPHRLGGLQRLGQQLR